MLAGLKRILKNIKSGTCKVRAAEITSIDFVDTSFGGSATAFLAFFAVKNFGSERPFLVTSFGC